MCLDKIVIGKGKSEMKTILEGPNGIQLILDPSQIDFYDPGNGTPAIVKYNGGSATYTCAVEEGEVDRGDGMIRLSKVIVSWLVDQEKYVDAMYDEAAKEYDDGH